MRGMATNIEKIAREAAELTRRERLTRFATAATDGPNYRWLKCSLQHNG